MQHARGALQKAEREVLVFEPFEPDLCKQRRKV